MYYNQTKRKLKLKIKPFHFPNLMINTFTSTIYVTQGLLENLTFFSREEIRAIIGHEIGHKNRALKDILFTILFTIASILSVGLCILISIYILLVVYRVLPFVFNDFTFRLVVLFPVAVCLYLSFFYMLRYREYKADEESIKLGNESKYLISFLRKMNNFYKYYEYDKPKNKVLSLVNSLFETHPSIDDRIKKLEQYKKI